MHGQDTPRPPKTEYRGRDWQRIHERWTAKPKAAAAGGSSARPVPRLGLSTHFAQYTDAIRAYPAPCYLATMTSYGPNGAEVVYRTVHDQPRDPSQKHTRTKPRIEKGTPRTEADPFNVEKSAWRARANIRKWIRMQCTPDTDYRLVTLSKRGGLPSIQACWDAVAAFRRQLAKPNRYPGVKFIAVPELHKGGGDNHLTFHVHCIMVFPAGVKPIYKVFHRLWYIALGGSGRETGADAPGNCDFANTHAGDGRRYTPCQAARYLAKYVSKDVFTGDVGQKRFTTTHGCPDPVKRYWWEPIDTNHAATRSRTVQLLRQWFPGETHSIMTRTFHSGGDTYHVFSAEPCPSG